MKKEFLILKKPNDLKECFAIRNQVFIKEQNFAEEIDIDVFDDTAHHLLLELDSKPVGTARFFKENDKWHIGRFCILKSYRSLGLGIEMLQKIENEIVKNGDNYMYLSAQHQVRDFYKKAGFKQVGEMYLEENYPHYKMEKFI